MYSWPHSPVLVLLRKLQEGPILELLCREHLNQLIHFCWKQNNVSTTISTVNGVYYIKQSECKTITTKYLWQEASQDSTLQALLKWSFPSLEVILGQIRTNLFNHILCSIGQASHYWARMHSFTPYCNGPYTVFMIIKIGSPFYSFRNKIIDWVYILDQPYWWQSRTNMQQKDSQSSMGIEGIQKTWNFLDTEKGRCFYSVHKCHTST